MVGAELLPDRRNVHRREFEELLAVEFAQPGRQGFLTDKSQGEGRHDWGRRIGAPMYRFGVRPGRAIVVWRGSVSREPAWRLGSQAKCTDLHEKYDYPYLGPHGVVQL